MLYVPTGLTLETCAHRVCIYMFCMDLETKSHWLTVQLNCLVFYIIEKGSVFCAVRTKYPTVVRVILVSKVSKITNLLR